MTHCNLTAICWQQKVQIQI